MATLVSRISDLATAIRDKFNAINPALVPTGGAAGQLLAKASATDFDNEWVDPPPNITVGTVAPTGAAEGDLWVDTN